MLARRLPVLRQGANAMNTSIFLLDEHRHLREQLEQLTNLSGRDLATAFSRFATDLVIHAELEEDIVYPHLQRTSLDKTVVHAYHEHHLIDVQIDELVGLSRVNADWKGKLHVLEETLNHHLQEEEEEVIPRLDDLLGADVSMQLAEDLVERRSEILHAYAEHPPRSAQAEAVRRVHG